MNTPFADAFEKVIAAVGGHVDSGTITESIGKSLLTRFVNGPIAAMLVKMTPNPYDDILLEIAKQLFPKT